MDNKFLQFLWNKYSQDSYESDCAPYKVMTKDQFLSAVGEFLKTYKGY